VAVEFVNMKAAVDRLAEATRVLSYLDNMGGFGELARDTLVADAVGRSALAPMSPTTAGRSCMPAKPWPTCATSSTRRRKSPGNLAVAGDAHVDSLLP
jgi:hypothetical protein